MFNEYFYHLQHQMDMAQAFFFGKAVLALQGVAELPDEMISQIEEFLHGDDVTAKQVAAAVLLSSEEADF